MIAVPVSYAPFFISVDGYYEKKTKLTHHKAYLFGSLKAMKRQPFSADVSHFVTQFWCHSVVVVTTLINVHTLSFTDA